MADYDTLESSVDNSRPIELYEFFLGTDPFRFTSTEDELTPVSDDFLPIAIARTAISQGSSDRSVIVTMPASEALAQKYISTPPAEKLALDVFRYQRDESPAFNVQVLIFQGIVQSVRFPGDGTIAEFTVRSTESGMNRNVPRFTFMGMCNHILYDDNCGVTASNFDHIGNVDSISGDTITVAGASASGIDFVGGYVTPTGDNDFRMVLAQSGDILTLLLPFATDPTGSNAQVFAGCNRVLTEDCALVFDNVAEFGGFHFVPSKNPFRGLPSV